MPRKYIRKCPDRKVCTQEQINTAMKLMEEGKSKRRAADIVGINESTLRKRLKLNSTATSMGRHQPTFTAEQEEEIYNHCKASDERFYGLTLNTLRKLVLEFVEAGLAKNDIEPQGNASSSHITDNASNKSTLSQSTPSSYRRPCKRSRIMQMIKSRKRLYESIYSTLHLLENTASNIVQQQSQQLQQEDEFHMFALSVAAQLRQLPLHTAIETQSKIQSTLSDARLASIFSDPLLEPSITVKKEDLSCDSN